MPGWWAVLHGCMAQAGAPGRTSPAALRSLVVRAAIRMVHVALPDGQDIVQGDHQAQPCDDLQVAEWDWQ